MVVAYEPSAPKDLQYSVTDVNRKFPMALLAGIFALAVVVVGRMRGVMALVALAVSFMVLTFFILPAILQGSNPLVVAVVGASAIMLIALYMCHGLSARTSVAVTLALGRLVVLAGAGTAAVPAPRPPAPSDTTGGATARAHAGGAPATTTAAASSSVATVA